MTLATLRYKTAILLEPCSFTFNLGVGVQASNGPLIIKDVRSRELSKLVGHLQTRQSLVV